VPAALLIACSQGTPSAPSVAWTHRPPGFTVWAEWPLDALRGEGWEVNNPHGHAEVVAVADAPASPPSVGRWRYPAGFAGGEAPANLYRGLPPAFHEGFVGVWWKASDPWQGHQSHVNKIFFLLGGACGNLVPVMYGPPGGPYELRVAPEWGADWRWLTPNAAPAPVALGRWHSLELYFRYHRGDAADGIVRFWLDGALVGDHVNVRFPEPGCFREFQFAPTWGGVGDVKRQADDFWLDHVQIAQPSASAAAGSAPRTLIQEGFEDDDLAGRGWYDDTAPLLSSAGAGGGRALEYRFEKGAAKPTAASRLRRKFAPTDAVYLSYRVRYGAEWVGSLQPYHPHEFHLLTTRDGDWEGLSFTHLTAYVEQNGGTPRVALQDGKNVDQAGVGRDLTRVTEHRAVAGCNGSSDGHPDHCYRADGRYVNEKKWTAAAPQFTRAPGPAYQGDWHLVEAFFKLNSIVDGRGVNDGIVRYWLDRRALIDHGNVLLRTGAHPDMRFNQIVIAPYIGDGSPAAQSLWIDDVTVATGRP
jgi:hypothetical protein